MKSIKAMSFDNKEEVTILVLILEDRLKKHSLYSSEIRKLLDVALEIEQMFINPTSINKLIEDVMDDK
tara:strand:+ start:818 stop:1021 length:204 start_codon:yes stop_codon:yes gene_type:complete